jgi:hypothetical protein
LQGFQDENPEGYPGSHLNFDNKMKLDGNPFPQNMVGFSVNMVTAKEKGKVKVLTSASSKHDGSVDTA